MNQEYNNSAHEGDIIVNVEGFFVIECKSCAFRHIMPLPSEAELNDIYKEEYYSTEKPLYLKQTMEDLKWWKLVYSERYELFESLLPDATRSILEVGSGPGYFLETGKERGWQTLGIEPSKKAASHATSLGVDIICDFLSPAVAKDLGTFDVVYMHEVLEHIPDPREMLALANTLLSPGGLISVIVPNDFNPIQEALTSALDFDPWWVAPPHHINYFTFASLESLLSSVGFEVVESTATFPIDTFLLMGDNYVGNDELGRATHMRRKLFEMNLERAGKSQLKRDLYKALAALNLGREIVMIGKKK